MAERKPNPNRDAHGLPLCSQDDCACYDGKRCSALGFRPDRFCEPALVEIVEERDALKARVGEMERRPGPLEHATRMAAMQGKTLGAGGVLAALIAGQPRPEATTIEQAPPEDLLDRITPEGGCRHTRRSLRPDPHGNPVATCIDCGDDLS